MSVKSQTVTDPALTSQGHAQDVPLTRLDSQSRGSSTEDVSPPSSNLKTATITIQLSGINFATSAATGLVVVGLPAMTTSLSIPPSLAFWPVSVYSLATASTLLLAGSIADALGPRWIQLIGSLICSVAMLVSGAVRTGEELVAMRAVAGVGMSMHLASSVSITTKTLERGRGRNVAFACLGLSQPLGFSFGLVVGGILTDRVGWRVGWWIYGSVTLLLTLVGFWAIPTDDEKGSAKDRVQGMKKTVDWVGASLASVFMATICYLLATLSTDVYRIRHADAISCLCLSVVSFGIFLYWMHRQVKNRKPALIPNSLWKNIAFSSICATISLSYATLNSLELFASLFFQEVQHLSALQASIRILPSLVVGIVLNLCVGLFIHKLPVLWLVATSSILCACSPLLMATVQPQWTYWANAFVAQLLQPVSADVLFTVGLIIITDVFPDDTQGLAGAVFNTMGQLGVAFGLAVLQVISQVVTQKHADLEETHALMEGYRASFWTMFGFMILCAAAGGLGLRKIGKVGVKQD
ncbi:MFS-type transporter 1 [Paramyrothecium foliicola]|nr:MFS-type transporter 1 [Paramyrothecium foliicola]